ncbi:MAG TPA: hypothetical protein VK972_06165, partial [Wenzhouxiangella sp.]|nr:hypothetical protein [Wenzhouxiangella sp.]
MATAALLSALASAAGPAAAEAWLRIDQPHALQRETLPPEAMDYGHFIWLPERTANRVIGSRPAHRFERPFDMRIDQAYFDPAEGFPQLPEEWLRTGPGPGSDWHLIQFTGPIRPQWLERLRESGLEPVQYIAPFGYIVWGRAKAVEAARTLDHLRFAGSLPPIMRVPQASRTPDGTGTVKAMALIHRGEQKRIISAM